jgi:glycosyltransferase involved in cell wall biosynthesis
MPDAPSRPRVLLVITLAEVGGAQSYVAALLPALAERYEVVLAAYGEGPLRAAAAGVGARFVPLRHVRRPINPLRDLAGLLELIALLRRERPRILHASSSKAGVLGRLAAVAARVPIRFFTVHGWAFSAYSGLPSLLYRVSDRLMAPLTTVTICVSETELAAGLEAGTCSPERSVVIHNAVDVSGAPRSRHDRPTPRLIAVGRLKAPKDFLTLIRALAALPGQAFEALIVGDGPERSQIEAEIRRLDLQARVRLAGERSDVPELLAESDVFVLSSRSEGLPVSVLEAMAAELPVVATDVGGLAELVVDGETGILVPPGDEAALTEALGRVVADRELRRRLGTAGRVRAESSFDLSAFRRAHLELYERQLGSAGAVAEPPVEPAEGR